MKSMTGFGAAEGKVGHGTIFVECKTVNHRYCDIQLKIPPKLNVLDPRLRKAIQSRVARGKVDLFMKERREIAPTPTLEPNVRLAAAYQRCLAKLGRAVGGTTPHLLEVVELPDLVRVEERTVRYERYWKDIARIVTRAVSQMERMRVTEGAHLRRDQVRRCRQVERLVGRITRAANALVAAYRRRSAVQQVAMATTGVAGERLETCIEITEEITRLQSHLVQYRRYCQATQPVGRQLDFLLQEMNREINTIGSKGNHAAISQLVVEAKSELEKLREQVQNIE